MTRNPNATTKTHVDAGDATLSVPSRPAYHVRYRGLGVGGSGILPSQEFEQTAGEYLRELVRATTARCFETGNSFKSTKRLSNVVAEKHQGGKVYVVTALPAVLQTHPDLQQSPFTATTVGIFHKPSSFLFLDREYVTSISADTRRLLEEDVEFADPGHVGFLSGGGLSAEWTRYEKKRKTIGLSPALSGPAMPISNSPLQACSSLDAALISELIKNQSSSQSLEIREQRAILRRMLTQKDMRRAASPAWSIQYDDSLQTPIAMDPILKSVSIAPKLVEIGQGFYSMLHFSQAYQLFAGNCLAPRGNLLDGTFAIHHALNSILSDRTESARGPLRELEVAAEKLFEQPHLTLQYRIAHDTLALLDDPALVEKVKGIFISPEKTAEALATLARFFAAQAPAFWEQYGVTPEMPLSNLAPMLSELFKFHDENGPCNPVSSYPFVVAHPASLDAVRLDEIQRTTSQKSSKAPTVPRGGSLELRQLGVERSYRSLSPAIENAALSILGVEQLKIAELDAIQLFENRALRKANERLTSLQVGHNRSSRALYRDNPEVGSYLYSLTQKSSRHSTPRWSVPRPPWDAPAVRAAVLNALLDDTFARPPFDSLVAADSKAAVKTARYLQQQLLSRALVKTTLPLGQLLAAGEPSELMMSEILENPTFQSKLKQDAEGLASDARKHCATAKRAEFLRGNYEEVVGYFFFLKRGSLPITADSGMLAASFLQQYGLQLLQANNAPDKRDLANMAVRIAISAPHASDADNSALAPDRGGVAQDPRDAVREMYIAAVTTPGQPTRGALDSFLLYQRLQSPRDFHPSLQPVWASLIRRYGMTAPGSVTSPKIGSIISLLDSSDQSYRSKIARILAPDSNRLTSLLTSQLPQEIKAFVLLNSPPDLIKDTLQHRDIDKIRDLLASFSLTDVLQLTHDAVDSHSRKIIRNREVYEQDQFPQTISHRYEDREIPNYFAVLGIPRSANDNMIKRSYRLLSEMYHPDRFMNESAHAQELAKERLKAIIDAHEVLSDREKRVKYLASLPVRSYFYPTAAWFKDLPSLDAEGSQ